MSTRTNQSGQILIISLIFMTVMLVLSGGLLNYVQQNTKIARRSLAAQQSLGLADAAIDKAIYQLNASGGTYPGETGTTLNTGAFDVSVTNISASVKEIAATGYAPNKANPLATKSLKVQVSVNTTVVSFNYGVQIGDGGLEMDSNSRVNGNAYSNGNIIGASNATITGTAIVADATGKIDSVIVNGDATGHFLEDITVGGNSNSASLLRGTVGGNAVSDSIANCTIGLNATYDTKTSCTIGGTQTTPNPNNFTDPPNLPLPISAQQITSWENEAAAGGTTDDTSVSGSMSLGPKKINGNLTVNNNATLTLTGTLWVTGTISINNNATVKLAASYGSQSGVLMGGISGSSTAGQINLSNNSILQGSGAAGSYLVVLSEMNSNSNTAISVSNNASGAIFYAGTGVIDLSNNAAAKEITAYKLELDQNAVVTYETGLANVSFTSGPGGSWTVIRGTWREIN